MTPLCGGDAESGGTHHFKWKTCARYIYILSTQLLCPNAIWKNTIYLLWYLYFLLQITKNFIIFIFSLKNKQSSTFPECRLEGDCCAGAVSPQWSWGRRGSWPPGWPPAPPCSWRSWWLPWRGCTRPATFSWPGSPWALWSPVWSSGTGGPRSGPLQPAI